MKKELDMLNERNFISGQELRKVVFDNQISITTINSLINKGKIPAVKLGRRNLIPVSYAIEQLGLSERRAN